MVNLSQTVLAPSDLCGIDAAIGKSFRVGGRIEWVGTDTLLVADALGNLRLRCSAEQRILVQLGDLVLLSVRRNDVGWAVESVEPIERCAPPGGNSEWANFARSGKAKRLAARDQVRRALRSWFESQGFIETETPTWLHVPGLDSDVDPIAAESGWLVTSPELCMKRLLVGGIPRLYQFAKCFRRDERGPRHEPEFTMLEWYRAFSDLEQMLDDTERLVVAAAAAVDSATSIAWGGRRISLDRPFERLSVADAFRRYASIEDVEALVVGDRNHYFQLFVDRVEPKLAEFDRPVFLHSYPIAEGALARVSPTDPRWAERAELYIAGIELCNAYSELTSAHEQRNRFQAELDRRADERQATYPLDERFLSALEQGMPPSSGNALGFDRLMMLLVDAETLEDVMAFPRSQL